MTGCKKSVALVARGCNVSPNNQNNRSLLRRTEIPPNIRLIELERKFTISTNQGCGGFWVESEFLSDSGCPLGSFLHHTTELGLIVEMVQFLMKLLLKQRFLAVHHNFHWFQQSSFIPFILRSRESEILPPTPQPYDKLIVERWFPWHCNVLWLPIWTRSLRGIPNQGAADSKYLSDGESKHCWFSYTYTSTRQTFRRHLH